jgi:deoxycytidylate deaminase
VGVNSFRHKAGSVHAEVDAFTQLARNPRALKQRLRKRVVVIDVFAWRTTKDGQMAMSKPCKHCIQHMIKLSRWYRVRKVIWTTGNIDKPIEIASLAELATDPNIHIARGNRAKIEIG